MKAKQLRLNSPLKTVLSEIQEKTQTKNGATFVKQKISSQIASEFLFLKIFSFIFIVIVITIISFVLHIKNQKKTSFKSFLGKNLLSVEYDNGRYNEINSLCLNETNNRQKGTDEEEKFFHKIEEKFKIGKKLIEINQAKKNLLKKEEEVRFEKQEIHFQQFNMNFSQFATTVVENFSTNTFQESEKELQTLLETHKATRECIQIKETIQNLFIQEQAEFEKIFAKHREEFLIFEMQKHLEKTCLSSKEELTFLCKRINEINERNDHFTAFYFHQLIHFIKFHQNYIRNFEKFNAQMENKLINKNSKQLIKNLKENIEEAKKKLKNTSKIQKSIILSLPNDNLYNQFHKEWFNELSEINENNRQMLESLINLNFEKEKALEEYLAKTKEYIKNFENLLKKSAEKFLTTSQETKMLEELKTEAQKANLKLKNSNIYLENAENYIENVEILLKETLEKKSKFFLESSVVESQMQVWTTLNDIFDIFENDQETKHSFIKRLNFSVEIDPDDDYSIFDNLSESSSESSQSEDERSQISQDDEYLPIEAAATKRKTQEKNGKTIFEELKEHKNKEKAKRLRIPLPKYHPRIQEEIKKFFNERIKEYDESFKFFKKTRIITFGVKILHGVPVLDAISTIKIN